jgi:CTP-dependent riboflavin kinase
LKGQVFSGKGEGATFVNLPWAKRQMEEELGFALFPGTLDIKLTWESAKMREILKGEGGFAILPASGYCPARLFKAKLAGVECGVVFPQITDYPVYVIELVSSVNLRKKLCLFDGSKVEVEVIF